MAGEEQTRVEYWLRQVMDPVRFVTGIRVLEARGIDAYLEIGPHPVLIGMGRQCVTDEARAAWIPSLKKGTDAWRTLLQGVGELYERGSDLDWLGFDQPYSFTRVSAPSYPFSDREYWLKHVPLLDGEAIPERAGPEAGAGAGRYELRWRPQPRQPAGSTSGGWVVFCDRTGVGEALTASVEARGVPVVTVRRGQRYVANGRYVQIDPAEPDHFARLIASLDPTATARIVYLWNLDAPSLQALEVSALEAAVLEGSTAVAYLARAIAANGSLRTRLSVVTRFAVPAPGDTAPIAMAQAPVWGFGRTAALEYPELWGGMIDLGSGEPAQVAGELMLEIEAGGAEDQVALRGTARFVARLEAAGQGPEAAMAAISPAATYLVTGGLGSLGLRVVEWLAAQGARHLVLASRTADRSTRAADFTALENRGVTIELFAADVSRSQDVEALLSHIHRSGRSLRGIVHAAGQDAPAEIARLSQADMQAAFAGKAIGAWLLHERTSSLDFFVSFSSMSSVVGAQGRAHYAAANAFLDALAIERVRLGLPATAISWGPWLGGGMATPETLRQFERAGNRGLRPAQALQLLGAAIASRLPHLVIADVEWSVFKPLIESRRPAPLLAQVDVAPARAASAETSQANWVGRLRVLPEAERLAALTALVRAEVADTLGYEDADSVPAERNLYELGVDSLMMADLVGRIRKQVGFSCSTLLFEHPTARGFARELLPRLTPDSSLVDPAGAGEAAPASTAAQETRNYAPEAEPEILAFQRREWPRRDPELIPARWRWMFLDSARRLDTPPRAWLHWSDGRIVGHMGSIPVKLQVGREVVETGWLVDTMVSDEHRSRGLGSRLMVEAHEDQPFSLSLGQTAEMREIQLRLGWQRVAPLQIAQYLIRPENVLRGKLPRPAAMAAGLGLRATAAVRGLVRSQHKWCVTEIERFGEAHDRLWQAVAPTIGCGVVRDASYLNWKYVDQPGQRFVRLEMVEDGALAAVAVLVLREPDSAYKYRRALLVDLVAPLDGTEQLQNAIRSAVDAAARNQADALVCMHVGPQLTRALKACGFAMRRPERELLVDATSMPPTLRARLLDGTQWLVTQGDSDIDRPW
jgi:NAD(P)-dependent dehydrogenase (short-subunit alcohol dehydrogenase family)/acyl carrier protein